MKRTHSYTDRYHKACIIHARQYRLDEADPRTFCTHCGAVISPGAICGKCAVKAAEDIIFGDGKNESVKY